MNLFGRGKKSAALSPQERQPDLAQAAWTGPVIDVRNPRTGEFDTRLATASADDVAREGARLRAGQTAWAAAGLEARTAVMLAWADAIEARAADIVAALEIDTGRRRIAHMEVAGAAASIRGWAARAPQLVPDGWVDGRMAPHIRHRPQFVPYSIVGVISPWNFPLTLSLIDSIPALLAGCAVMLKPSEVTPRFAAPLMEAVADAPGLGDVFTVVQGAGDIGQAVIDASDMICFTGSVATGRKVAVRAAERFIPVSVELGGKDPLIVLDGADVDMAVTAALRGSVTATGQACQSIERIYVDRKVFAEFLEKLVEAAKAVRLNAEDISVGELGPLIFARQAEIIAAQLEDALNKGATIRTGGKIEHHGGGCWLRPTVVINVTHDMDLMREETFGPVLPLMAFDTVEEAVALANDTEFGLSAAVFAGTLEEAEAVGRQLEAGAVSLNDCALTASFHEAEKQSFKASGMGPSRMGEAGFQRFFRRKALIANTAAPAAIQAIAEEG